MVRCFSFSFPESNFFEMAIFAIVKSLGLLYTAQGSIANYLIICLDFQFLIITLMQFVKAHQYIYPTIIVFNIVAASYSLYSGLYLQLVYSPHLYNVFLYGILGLVFTVLTSLFVKYIKIPNIFTRKIFHLSPLILFPLFDNKFSDIFQIALVGMIYIFVVLELLRYFSVN